jgi:hypothetical protein
MTRQASDPADDGVPSDLVRELNELGFALVGSGRTHTFTRTAIGNELELTLEPLGGDVWRVGVKWRPSTEPGREPYALVPMPLDRLGESADGVTIDFSVALLLDALPRLLAQSILPRVDSAPGLADG